MTSYPFRALSVLVLALPAHSWVCDPINIYVNPTANITVDPNLNGSTPDAAFATVAQAAEHVAWRLSPDGLKTGDTSKTAQLIVNIAEGIYRMDDYVWINNAHSGIPECPTIFQSSGRGAVLSGGTPITNWTEAAGMDGVYQASVPQGSKTRTLYVDGAQATRARGPNIFQNETIMTSTSFAYNGSSFDITSIDKPEHAELRFVGTFTDRYMPINYKVDDGFVMKQPAWYRNLIGYDVISKQFSLFLGQQGMWIENSLTFLNEGGEWYLDEEASTLYYKPIDSKDPNTSDIVLPKLEVLLSLSGLGYDQLAHDIEINNIIFAHTAWNYPSSNYGYPDQQTGAFIGEPYNRTNFEAFRPHWYQTPAAVQFSAAERITMRGGQVTCTGGAGIGIGNDNNAHLSGIGLGAKDITITGVTVSETAGNGIQVGGISANAHHPMLTQMIVSGIDITRNYLYANTKIYNSANNIMMTYVQYSKVTHNTIVNTTYTPLSQGWGWGSNDEGGNPSYNSRGLYLWQPRYFTPTTLHDNYLAYNLIKNVGINHTDEGGIYTLSKSPGTIIEKNVILNARSAGLYFDEGSQYYTARDNVVDARVEWETENLQGNGSTYTGNNTMMRNYVTHNVKLDIGNTPQNTQFIGNIYFNPNETYPAGAQAIVDGAGHLA